MGKKYVRLSDIQLGEPIGPAGSNRRVTGKGVSLRNLGNRPNKGLRQPKITGKSKEHKFWWG